ncbi:MAG TPA: alpha/beta hydrolase, partial [Candidatus Acidoferrales bacterium]|nr:alpha/beta hydrolase [Candidatus Acidoferrales bacterium]
YAKLAAILSDAFTVYVMDRRGRGLSGAQGDDFSVEREVEDVQALATKTGACTIFGHSSGALVVLRAARITPMLERIALYEPPFSIAGSIPTDWLDRYEQELTSGNSAAAVVTAMRGLQVVPMFVRIPRIILVPLLRLVMRVQGRGDAEDIPIRALAPTIRYDMRIVREMGDTLQDYSGLPARVLLLSGAKSPAFLGAALDALERTLPHVERVTFPGLGHDGPEGDGKPNLVARELRRFFG